jgi:superfamily II DNA/RNA helicase
MAVRVMFAFPCVQADKLLSPEFQLVIAELIGFLPENRQLCMYSATFPVTVKDFKVKHKMDTKRGPPRGWSG